VNYNEMSADQCADWLAEKDGWVKTLAKGADESDGEDGHFWAKGGKWQWEHPMPLTLDAAAGALREPWGWSEIEWWDNAVIARYFNRGVRASGWPAFMQRVDGPDELTARYRAAVAAMMEEDK